jgi:hypothetical protein
LVEIADELRRGNLDPSTATALARLADVVLKHFGAARLGEQIPALALLRQAMSAPATRQLAASMAEVVCSQRADASPSSLASAPTAGSPAAALPCEDPPDGTPTAAAAIPAATPPAPSTPPSTPPPPAARTPMPAPYRSPVRQLTQFDVFGPEADPWDRPAPDHNRRLYGP